MAWLQDVLPSVTDAESDEAVPVGWAFLYFFCLLCGYYILRPVRDEMAIEGGVQHLPWMMTATFVTLLLVTPLFGWLSARVPRYRLLLIIYAFFGLHLVVFFAAMMGHLSPQWTARAFFVWLSVFNLFVVSIFWSVMADVFTPAQGARLFGVIAAGGSIGAMVGPLLTTGFTYLIPIPVLLLISVGFLVACVVCVYQLDQWARTRPSRQTSLQGEPIGGSVWAGVRLAFSSPYLLGICFYLFFLTTTATFLYLEQMRLVSEQIASPEGRTRLFALIDLVVNVLTFLTQVTVTSRVISRFGLGAALVVLPVASAIGFGMIGLMPILTIYIFFTIVRRVGEYALAKPSREVLFTVVSREEKYKAKSFIDTAVSRGGDAMTGWIVNGVKMLGITAGQMVWVLIPLTLLWGWVGWFLARQEEKLRGG